MHPPRERKKYAEIVGRAEKAFLFATGEPLGGAYRSLLAALVYALLADDEEPTEPC